MSFAFTVQWDESVLPRIAEEIAVAGDEAAHEAAIDVRMLAQQYVAVDTSSLHDTIDEEQVEPGSWSVNAGDTEGGYKGGGKGGKSAGSPVDYAVHQEYNGTPYMTPAAEEAWQPFLDDLSTRLAALGI